MNCLQFRQETLADPYHLSAAARLHRNGCPKCTGFFAEIEALDSDLVKEFSVAVPEGLAAKILLNQSIQSNPRRPTRWYWMGMAASFFLAVAVVLQVLPGRSLGAEIITHMDHDAHQVHGRAGDLDNDHVNSVLLSLDSELVAPLGTVTHASVCIIDEKVVAHLVVEHRGSTFTVLLLPESPDAVQAFSGGRWLGQVVAHPAGSLAIIIDANEAEANLDAATAHFAEAIGYRSI